MLHWASKILLGFLVCVILGVVTGLFVVGRQARRELAVFNARHAVLQERLDRLQAERATKEAYLRAFINDPAFVERVVRERLGYVEPGELIFRYENR